MQGYPILCPDRRPIDRSRRHCGMRMSAARGRVISLRDVAVQPVCVDPAPGDWTGARRFTGKAGTGPRAGRTPKLCAARHHVPRVERNMRSAWPLPGPSRHALPQDLQGRHEERRDHPQSDLDSARSGRTGKISGPVRSFLHVRNRLHDLPDIACDEDRCRAHAGNVPRAIATLSTIVVSLVRQDSQFLWLPPVHRHVDARFREALGAPPRPDGDATTGGPRSRIMCFVGAADVA